MSPSTSSYSSTVTGADAVPELPVSQVGESHPPLAVRTENLTKHYGDVHALTGVCLNVPQGSIYGFLGRNGAGKTTLTRILLGFTHASSGSAFLCGEKLSPQGPSSALREYIGYLPDVPGFYPWMNARETLECAAHAYRIPNTVRKERVDNLMELMGLARNPHEVGGYSRGMKQRLGLAQALINAPKLLILDEPTSALDPLGRREVLDIIASLRGHATVVFSTHLLADAQSICDHVGILDQGILKAEGTLESITRNDGITRLSVHVERNADSLRSRCAALPWCVGTHADGTSIIFDVTDAQEAGHAIPAIIAEEGLSLLDMHRVHPDLETSFVQIVHGERK